MRRLVVVVAVLLLGWVAILVLTPGGWFDHSVIRSWTGGGPSPWPGLERMSAALRLDPPGRVSAVVRLELSGLEPGLVPLLLNRGLDVSRVEFDGGAAQVHHGRGLGGRYHSEGRVIWLELDPPPADGRAEVTLHYAGAAEHGATGSDWRGILLVDESEARMSEQTVFVPKVPLSADGSGAVASPFQLQIDAPAGWQVGATGVLQEPPRTSPDGARATWRFAADVAAHPNVVAGERVRVERVHDGQQLVALMREEHVGEVDGVIEAAVSAREDLQRLFGPGAPGSLTIFEQTNREGYSYNWTAEGLIVFDRWALGGEVPLATLAHEVAHLWWGQTVCADGPGERFLTEGLCEASSWVHLERIGRRDKLQGGLASARADTAELLDEGRSRALAEFGFGTPGYSELAYAKSALVHRWVAGMLGQEHWSDFNRAWIAAARAGEPSTLATWERLLDAQAPGLFVPWLHHDGELELTLSDVTVDVPSRTLRGTISARALPEGGDMPARVRAVVEVLGRGFRERRLVDVDGTTLFSVDLSGVAGDGPAHVIAVALDPDELMPRHRPQQVVLDGPRLLSCLPAPGSDDTVMGARRIELTFDRPLEPFTPEEFLDSRPVLPRGASTPRVVSVGLDDEGRTLVLQVSPLSPGTGYVLPLGGALRDRWGGPPVEQALRFSTAPSSDKTPAVVVRTDPPVGATGVSPSLREVVVEFDEPMRRGVGFKTDDIDDLKAAGWTYAESSDYAQWDDDAQVLRIPLEPLEPGTRYALPIGRNYRNLTGLATERVDVTFTTGPEQRP